jgi:hypothetical protein
MGTLTWDIASGGVVRLAPAMVGVEAPEPDIWAMMIIGIGLAGTAMRRRRVLAHSRPGPYLGRQALSG